MSNFTLHNTQNTFTAVSNRFLDEYMPKANGEFVKVYLHLLRLTNDPSSSVSISDIADKLNHTETDVFRALRYWEQEGLLAVSWISKTELSDITLCECSALEKSAPSPYVQPAVSSGNASLRDCSTDDTAATVSMDGTLPDIAYTDQDAKANLYKAPEKPNYTAAQLEKFLKSDDIEQILYVCQKYLGNTLSSTETNTILYFYDSLHFSVELIEYLVEYCVSINQRNIRYIEKVALSWAEKGFKNVTEAKANTTTYTKNCFAVMKAFGLSNRRPGNSEVAMIQKWTNTYGFTIDIVLEACNRTIRAIHQPSFEYADGILIKWKSQGVKHIADIVEQDKKYLKNSKQGKENAGKSIPASPSNNRFNNMTPRDYAYDDLEKQLLNR